MSGSCVLCTNAAQEGAGPDQRHTCRLLSNSGGWAAREHRFRLHRQLLACSHVDRLGMSAGSQGKLTAEYFSEAFTGTRSYVVS